MLEGRDGSDGTGRDHKERFLCSVLREQFCISGSMVKRLRHRPFTAVTRVRFPLES